MNRFSPLRRNGLTALAMACLVLGARPSTAAPVDETGIPTPTYTAGTCCQLCPRVADPRTYITSYLQDNKYLTAGIDGAIFRSQEDWRTDFAPEEPEVFEDMARIARTLQARGITVVAVPVPSRGLVQSSLIRAQDRPKFDFAAADRSYRAVLDQLRRGGFVVPDMTRLYTEDDPQKPNFFFRRDGHWTPTGSRRAAQLVAETVRALPAYPSIDRKAFSTRAIGVSRIYGAISLVSSALCGGSFQDEIVPKYETLSAAASDDLLGDVTTPSITLVGTSMSANPNYHFHGFLETELQADILNVAKSGGSIDGSITEYLTSEPFLNTPPKIIVWEFVVQQLSLVQHTKMQRVVPRVLNGCVGKPALIENVATLEPQAEHTDLVYNGGERLFETPSRKLVVDIQLSDPSVKELLTEAWYLDGKTTKLRLRYNEFTDAKGRFVFELSRKEEYQSQPLIMLRGQLTAAATTAVTAKVRMCTGAIE